MSNPPVLHPGGVVSRDQQQQLVEMERAIIQAVAEAKFAGVPQGLIVAVLHGQSTIQTNIMEEQAYSFPKDSTRLGAYCPSGDLLDQAIDSAMGLERLS